jgi:hypothetical protein
MELFEAQCSVPAEAVVGGALSDDPSSLPVNAEWISSRTDFSDT